MFPYPFKIYQEELPEDFCNHIINLASSLETEEGGVHVDGNTKISKEARNNNISWINNSDIIELMQIYTVKANQECGWNFDIGVYETPQLSTYSQGQFYDWHVDIGVEEEYDPVVRKLTISINLNNAYDGGNFQIERWGSPKIKKRYITVKGMKKTGSILVFPSFLHHRVTPVVQGQRKSLTCWFRGPPFR
jgi:PKHD-type hydroxylase